MATNNDFVPGFDDEQQDTLKFTLSPINGIPNGIIVVLNGYIDTYNSSFFQSQISKIINYKYINLIFECSNLTGLASTGFGILTALLKKVNQWGGDLVLASLQPQIIDTITLLGFAHFFKIVPSCNEAVVILSGIMAMQGQNANTQNQMVFPLLLACPACKRQLRAQHAGRFRCTNCKTIINITEQGQVSIE